MSYFMHRIQKTGDDIQKGIEVHSSLDSAVLSFWGRVKLAYGKSDNDFVSCKITDESGNVVAPYDMTWLKEGEEVANMFFLHHIRKEGDNYDKNIDVLESLDSAKGDFAALMEYGYNNPRHSDVSFVSCYITDLLSGGMVLESGVWVKTVSQPEPEPEE